MDDEEGDGLGAGLVEEGDENTLGLKSDGAEDGEAEVEEGFEFEKRDETGDLLARGEGEDVVVEEDEDDEDEEETVGEFGERKD